jgi:hypothetical protein
LDPKVNWLNFVEVNWRKKVVVVVVADMREGYCYWWMRFVGKRVAFVETAVEAVEQNSRVVQAVAMFAVAAVDYRD